MSCSCQSGDRTLILLAPRLSERYPEFRDFQPDEGWEVDEALDAVRVRIGPRHRWATAHEAVNFLRAVLDIDRLHDLRAGWVGGRCGSLADDVARIASPRALVDLAPLDASPLMDMLANRRIETWFQPVFTAGGLELWGYECLMRGRDAAGAPVSPGQVLAWARQEELYFMLDRVCREVHLENAGRAGLPRHAKLLINFLPTAIYEPAFCLRTTMAAVHRSGIEPSRIIFEVVESEEIRDHERLAAILAYYREHGFGVALDDVGAGYSGLMMLADLDPDLVKIDRALVHKAPTSKIHRNICRALIDLAHDAGKVALAEGVETAEERGVFEELGVDLLQGYLLAEPAPHPVTEPVALQRAA